MSSGESTYVAYTIAKHILQYLTCHLLRRCNSHWDAVLVQPPPTMLDMPLAKMRRARAGHDPLIAKHVLRSWYSCCSCNGLPLLRSLILEGVSNLKICYSFFMGDMSCEHICLRGHAPSTCVQPLWDFGGESLNSALSHMAC